MNEPNKPRTSGRGRKYSTVNHHEISARLKATPNEWGRVGEYAARYVAYSCGRKIDTGSRDVPMYRPPGSFESRFTMTDDGWLLEARYIDNTSETTIKPIVITPMRIKILRTLAARTEFRRTADLADASELTYSTTHKFMQKLHRQRLVDQESQPAQAPSRTPFHLYRLNDRGRKWAADVLRKEEG